MKLVARGTFPFKPFIHLNSTKLLAWDHAQTNDEMTQQEAVVLSCARDKSLGAGLADI
jgi:hypothetical protein